MSSGTCAPLRPSGYHLWCYVVVSRKNWRAFASPWFFRPLPDFLLSFSSTGQNFYNEAHSSTVWSDGFAIMKQRSYNYPQCAEGMLHRIILASFLMHCRCASFHKKKHPLVWVLFFMVAGEGLEPTTSGLWARRATDCSTPRRDACL